MYLTVDFVNEIYYAPAFGGGVKQCCNPSVRLSLVRNSTTLHFRTMDYVYLTTPIGNSILEVEPTGQRACSATGSGRNGNKSVACAASEAFAKWLHH